MLTMLEHALWPADTTEDQRDDYIALGFALEGRLAQIEKVGSLHDAKGRIVERGWITKQGHMTDDGRSALATSYGWPVEDIERIDRSDGGRN